MVRPHWVVPLLVTVAPLGRVVVLAVVPRLAAEKVVVTLAAFSWALM